LAEAIRIQVLQLSKDSNWKDGRMGERAILPSFHSSSLPVFQEGDCIKRLGANCKRERRHELKWFVP
jgi:hypothetical protein